MPNVERNESEMEPEFSYYPVLTAEFNNCMDCEKKIALDVKRCDECQEKVLHELAKLPELKRFS